MEIIIAHGKTKRKIKGPFSICISGEELNELIDTLKEAGTDFGYGWIEVPVKLKHMPNTMPIGWDD